jgi:spore maturation protein CgeB
VKPNEWEDSLELLITDEKKRKELGENAYEFVKTNWQYENSNISSVVDEMLKSI